MHGHDIDYGQAVTFFRENRYLHLTKFLPLSLLELLKIYCQILQANNKFRKDYRALSLAIECDPGFDSVLCWINPEVNRLIGLDLAPSDCCARRFAKGGILQQRLTHAPYEICATACLEVPPGATARVIHFKPSNMPDAQIDLREGDLYIYACAEIKPWAEPAPADDYIELVMHFIDKAAFGRPNVQ